MSDIDQTPSSDESEAAGAASGGDSQTQAETPGDENVVRKSRWERCLYMVFFSVIGYFAFWATVLLAVVQFVVVMVNGQPSEDLRRWGTNLAEYLREVGRYITYAGDEKPCPFGPFPNVGMQVAE